jgi:pyruvate dehydrogenase E1 component
MPSDLGETIGDEYVHQLPDTNPIETQEWLESLDAVAGESGTVRARFLLAKLLERAHETRLGIPAAVTTPYVNTIPLEEQPPFPGDEDI